VSPGSVLGIERLTVDRGGRAVVQRVSLDIPAGQVTALLGPNGAGKSSLVLAVGGLLRPAGGRVTLDGLDLTGRRPERIRQTGVAVVPEGRRLLSELTVEENLRVATYSLTPAAARAGRARARELFPELDGRRAVPAHALSGGEQQMLVLAQALVSRPRFVLIDELSLGLAPLVVQRLIPTIHAISESGVGVLLIEQFATIALDLAERAYVMDRGRIRFSGLASELRTAPEMLRSAYLPGPQRTTGRAVTLSSKTPNGASMPLVTVGLIHADRDDQARRRRNGCDQPDGGA